MMRRLYRLLLRFYPATFRQQFGADMTAAFAALEEERRARGRSLPALWTRTLIDVVTNGTAERIQVFRSHAGPFLKGPSMWHSFSQDVQYAFRGMRRSPGLAVVVVLTMALGIGAATAIFSLVRATMLRPMPFANPEGLFTIWMETQQGAIVGGGWLGPQLGDRLIGVAPPYLADLRARATSLDRLAGVSPSWDMTLTGVGDASVAQAVYVSDGVLDILGLSPRAGRDFLAEEHLRGAARAALVSSSMARRIAGEDTAALGRPLKLNGQPYTIVGILPDDARFPGTPGDIWIPFVHNDFAETRRVPVMTVLARLRDGVSVEQARSELTSIAQIFEREFPTSKGNGLALVPLSDRASRRARPTLFVLGASVALLVLIAVANIANLLLARASVRQREIAVRTALGAGRWRIVRQVLTESVVLAFAGAAAGALFAYWSLGTLVQLLQSSLPQGVDVRIDGQVLLFTALTAIVTGILFGLAPAVGGSRAVPADALRHGVRAGENRRRLRQGLVAAEVALAFVLLVGAGLLIRSFIKLSSVDPGFRTERVLAAPISLPEARYSGNPSKLQFFDRVLASVAALPGVRSAAVVNRLPLGGATNNAVEIQIEGRESETGMSADRRIGSPGYFATMSIPVIAGRSFDGRDTPASERVAIINQSLARRYWGRADPLGARLRIQLLSGPGPWSRVVGVVGDVRHHGLGAEVRPEIWVPHSQAPVNGMVLIASTTVDPDGMLDLLRRTIQAQDPELPVSPVSMENVVHRSMQASRSQTSLLSVFAAAALVLAMIGITGVVAHAVSRMLREIGVRIALGAGHADILRFVLAQGIAPAALGLVVGAIGALLTSRALRSMLFDISPFDPATFLIAAGALLLTATLASLVPALRAMRVDPVVVLRVD